MEKREATGERIALLVAAACVLQVVESFFPHPLPGVRLGLANVVALLALFDLGFSACLQVAILRTVVASLTLGTFLSPTFVLSLSGAVVSALLMGSIHRLTVARGKGIFSVVGISVLGAVAHNMTQLAVIFLFLGGNKGALWLCPWLVLMGVGTGLLSGLIAAHALRRIFTEPFTAGVRTAGVTDEGAPVAAGLTCSGDCWLVRVPATVKILVVVVFCCGVLLSGSLKVLCGSVGALVVFASLSGVALRPIIRSVSRIKFILLFCFILPILFTRSSGQPAYYPGLILASRLIIVVLLTNIMMQTTRPNDIAAGLSHFLFPLRIFAISPKGVSRTISQSLVSIPMFWEKLAQHRRERQLPHAKLREIIPWISDLLVCFYQEGVFVEVKAEE